MKTLRKPATVIHKEGRWELLNAKTNMFNIGPLGWQSVIKHHCTTIKGAPYWMILEHSNDLTQCLYCGEPMPPSIVCLFKLQNWECIRP